MAYRVIKAAEIQVTVPFGREREKEGRGVTIICIEPEFAAMRLPGFKSVDDVETCITGMVKVINGLQLSNSGSFIK